jgi:hypothetical protein
LLKPSPYFRVDPTDGVISVSPCELARIDPCPRVGEALGIAASFLTEVLRDKRALSDDPAVAGFQR